MRLFTAVFPPQRVKDHLGLAIDGVPASPRWVPRESLHITLAFYADLPEGTVPELRDELADVARKHAPIDLRLRGAGSFGARVLWIGVDGGTGALKDLAADCLAASPREVPEDVKPHRAHVTQVRGFRKPHSVQVAAVRMGGRSGTGAGQRRQHRQKRAKSPEPSRASFQAEQRPARGLRTRRRATCSAAR